MKEKEAIDMLKAVKGYVKCIGVDESINMAISALEKQIPKKPIFHDMSPLLKDIYNCADCGTMVNGSDLHCRKCGQAIDWSDDE